MTAIWDLQVGHRTFDEPALQKAFYHPSRRHRVNPSDQKLSPERAIQRGHGNVDAFGQNFIKGSNVYQSGHARPLNWSQDSPSFSELWPDSERPSTIDQSNQAIETSLLTVNEMIGSTPDRKPKGLNDVNSKRLNEAGKRKEEPESVLSKYVQRFRKAAPQSREDRTKLKVVNPNDFWWLHDTSNNSYDEETRALEMKDPHRLDVTSKLEAEKHLLDSGKHFTTERQSKRVEDWLDKETQSLHVKADTLLERAESTLSSLSSHPVVSTAGLGSEPSTSAGSMFAEEPYRPRFTLDIGLPSPAEPMTIGPDDDILEQWRRRRRADQAKERIRQADSEQHVIPYAEKPFDINSTLEAFRQRLGLSVDAPIDGATVGVARLVQSEVSKPVKKDADVQTTLTKDADVQTSLVDDSQTVSPRAFNSVFDVRSHSRQVSDSRSCPHCVRSRVPLACPHVVPAADIRSGAHYVEPHLHMSCDVISADSRKQLKLRRDRAPVSNRRHRAGGDFLDNVNSAPSSDDSDWVIDRNNGVLNDRITRPVIEVDRGQGSGRHEVQQDRGQGRGRYDVQHGRGQGRGRHDMLPGHGKNKFSRSGEPSRRMAEMSERSKRQLLRLGDDLDDEVPLDRVHSDIVPSHRLMSDGVHTVNGAGTSKHAGEDLTYGRGEVSKQTVLVGIMDVDVVATKDSKAIRSDVQQEVENAKRISREDDDFAEDFHGNKQVSRHRSEHARGQRSKERARHRGTEERPESLGPRVAVSSPTRARNHFISQVVDDRLFEMSDSLTVVSSFENCPPHQESPWPQLDSLARPELQLESDPFPDQGEENVEDLESLVLSDGEEFCDDSILVDLRNRRSMYLSLLKQLDSEIQLQRNQGHGGN